jgi:hypothetical protein
MFECSLAVPESKTFFTPVNNILTKMFNKAIQDILGHIANITVL